VLAPSFHSPFDAAINDIVRNDMRVLAARKRRMLTRLQRKKRIDTGRICIKFAVRPQYVREIFLADR
jgi:hypothetical protein